MTHPKTLLLLAAVAILGGCKSGPAKICDKIDQLSAKAMLEGDEGAKKMATNMSAEASTCVTRMETLERNNPAEFAKASTCIEGASDIKQVVQCFFKAAMSKGGNEAGSKPPGGGAGDGVKAPESAPAP